MTVEMRVDDSTEWAGTRAPYLQRFEECLRCPICHDLYDSPTITDCGHSFCGMCIRRHLDLEAKCPTCRGEVQRARLKPNKALEDSCDVYRPVRSNLLALLRRYHVGAQQTHDVIESDPATQSPHSLLTAPNSEDREGSEEPTHINQSESLPDPQPHKNPVGTGGRSEPQDIGYPESDDEKLAECPVCGQWWPISFIQGDHMPECLANTSRKRRQPEDFSHRREPLPNYNVLKDKALRDLAARARLSSVGTRQDVIARHREWVNRWNTNIDSKTPKSPAEVRRDVLAWERTRPKELAVLPLKDLDAKAYARVHESDFAILRQKARESLGKK